MKPVNVDIHFDIMVKDVEAFRVNQAAFAEWFGRGKYGNMNWSDTMSRYTKNMSHDRVRFFLSDCYYNSGCKKDAMRVVLEKAFGMSETSSQVYMAQGYGGFFIVCRPSQFTRFMIYRNEAGQKNGFMDLQAKLFTPEPPKDAYTRLADIAGITPEQAKRVSLALCYSGRGELESQLDSAACLKEDAPEVDVGLNKHVPESPCSGGMPQDR